MAHEKTVDILIEGGSIISMDDERRIIRNGVIAVEGDQIVDVGARSEIGSAYKGRRVIDAGHHVITPGLINTHMHFYHQMHRGLSPDNLNAPQWSDYVHSKVVPHMTEDDEIWGAYLVLIELMKSGTTTFLAAGSYNPGAVLEAIPKVGLRGFEGRRTFDYAQLGHVWLMDDTPTAIRENQAIMERYSGGLRDGLIRPCVNVVGIGRCTDELYLESKKLADRHDAILNMHQCAFREEIEEVKKRTGGVTPIKHLDNLGVLGPNVVISHAIHVTDEEVEILARTGAHVSHNPGTALKLTYGIVGAGKFPEMLDAGVTVSLGTDAGDCSNFMDMLRAMHLAALLFKEIRYDPTLMGAEAALEMATLHGARALGMENEIGSLEPGKKADIVLFDSDTPEWQPLYCEPYNLVYSASGGSVETVLVGGEVVLEKRKVLTIDEGEVIGRVKELSGSLQARADVAAPTKWPIV